MPFSVFMGICFLRRVPGFVVALPRPLYFTRAGFSSLSIVGADMLCNAVVTVLGNVPYSSVYDGSHNGKRAFNRFEHGRSAARHMTFRCFIIEGLLYTEGLPRFLGLGFVNRLKLLRILIACFL